MSTTLHDEMARLFAVLNPPLNEGRGRVLQFVAAQPGEGVSTIAREFARVAALQSPDNVLLLDLNTTGQGQYEFFKEIERRDHSLTVGEALDIGVDPAGLWRAVSETQHHDRVLLPQGDLVSFHRIGSTRLLVSRFNREVLYDGQTAQVTNRPAFWDELREAVNFTIVDSPASSRSIDGIAVSTMMDAVVLVVEAESTRVPVIEDLRDRLRARGAHLAGVVFNKRSFYIPEPIYRLL
jgi:Mrp family chromosome partitioning ATPase